MNSTKKFRSGRGIPKREAGISCYVINESFIVCNFQLQKKFVYSLALFWSAPVWNDRRWCWAVYNRFNHGGNFWREIVVPFILINLLLSFICYPFGFHIYGIRPSVTSQEIHQRRLKVILPFFGNITDDVFVRWGCDLSLAGSFIIPSLALACVPSVRAVILVTLLYLKSEVTGFISLSVSISYARNFMPSLMKVMLFIVLQSQQRLIEQLKNCSVLCIDRKMFIGWFGWLLSYSCFYVISGVVFC